jgi:ubiquinone/menaquinone biosynthesis C-methylase UbiE
MKFETFFSFFNKKKYVCPWYMAYTFDNPIRKLVHNPNQILGAYIKKGMVVADIGCGMGYFSLAMAKLVGHKGKVYAIDLQQKMLDILKKRSQKQKLSKRISLHKCTQNKLDLNLKFNFILAFWMVHEVPDQDKLLKEIHTMLNPDGKLLISEPLFHVSKKAFNVTCQKAHQIGFKIIDHPKIFFNHAVVLKKAGN